MQSIEQIGNRADRMRIGTEELFLYSSTDVEVHFFLLCLSFLLIFLYLFLALPDLTRFVFRNSEFAYK